MSTDIEEGSEQRAFEQKGSLKDDDEFQYSMFNAQAKQPADMELYSIGKVKHVTEHDGEVHLKKSKTEEYQQPKKFNGQPSYDEERGKEKPGYHRTVTQTFEEESQPRKSGGRGSRTVYNPSNRQSENHLPSESWNQNSSRGSTNWKHDKGGWNSDVSNFRGGQSNG